MATTKTTYEWTNLISPNQQVERFIPIIGKDRIFGDPLDYDKKTRKIIEDILRISMGRIDWHRNKQQVYISLLVPQLKNTDWKNLRQVMNMHPFASLVLDMTKAFPNIINIEWDRIYYTKLDKNKKLSDCTANDFFPTNTDSNEPSARVARGEYGNIFGCWKENFMRKLEEVYGYQFDKEADNLYTMHLDFRIIFDFSNLRLLKLDLEDAQWRGAFITLMNYLAENQNKMRENWLRSEQWWMDYREFHCPYHYVHFDFEETSTDEHGVEVNRPRTFERWYKFYLPNVIKKGYVYDEEKNLLYNKEGKLVRCINPDNEDCEHNSTSEDENIADIRVTDVIEKENELLYADEVVGRRMMFDTNKKKNNKSNTQEVNKKPGTKKKSEQSTEYCINYDSINTDFFNKIKQNGHTVVSNEGPPG